ncbi:hypothetical protein SYNPS1DRAFT_21862 [Syncephalis pseudoplumigaleata]|uniref:RGS domain-containing protein n=1 Tax=Syncephalis pseudoplumigaleata TaxID=1712513 RepID=A0A4P9Z1Y9_9FUNG|nr:hypothetical protein SYNPS1DRAFT_21862 [Syncephalis pseudoplumigaleata]|eukprot:RKP26358.1 hypothetical protein SYNPS1DRAFT_21862 [Syncephalis pseudoplumigaleata]
MSFFDDHWPAYLGLLATIVCVAAIPSAFVYKKRHFPGLRHRGILLTLINGALPVIMLSVLLLRLVVQTPIACIYDVWVATAVGSLYAFLIMVRAIRVIVLYHVSEARYRMTRNPSNTSATSLDSDPEGSAMAAAASERPHRTASFPSAGSMTRCDQQQQQQQRRRPVKAWKSHEHLKPHPKHLPSFLRRFQFGLRESPSTILLRKKTATTTASSPRDDDVESISEFNSQTDLVEMNDIRIDEYRAEVVAHANAATGTEQRDHRPSSMPTATTATATTPAANDAPPSPRPDAARTHSPVPWSPESPPATSPKFDFLSIKPEKTEYTWMYRHRHWIRTPFIMRAVAVVFILQLAITATVQTIYGPGPSITPSTAIHCYVSTQYMPVYGVGLCFGLAMMFVVGLQLRCVNDAFYIRAELMTSVAVAGSCVLLGVFAFTFGKMKEDFSLALQSYLYTSSLVVLCISIYTVAIIFPLVDAIRLDRLSKAASGFTEALADPASFEKFKIFSIIDFSVENVLFYDRVRRLRALSIKKHSIVTSAGALRRHRSCTLDTTSSGGGGGGGSSGVLNRRMEKELRAIYHKFIVPGSEYELNLEYDTRKAIMEAVQQNTCDITIYDAAFDEITSLLVNNTYPRFLQWNSGQNSADDIDGAYYSARSTEERQGSAFADMPHAIVVDKADEPASPRELEARVAQLERKRRPAPLIHRMRDRVVAYLRRLAYKSAWELAWFVYVSKLRDLLAWGILRAYWQYSRWQRRGGLAMQRAIGHAKDWTR